MDIFMASIEFIISKRKKIYTMRDDLTNKLEIRIWDDVIANLTLLCLGTSAPEVFLSVIEIVGHNFEAGYLGPGAIVGAGAVNLIIIAFCNIALSYGEVRAIKKYAIFCLTSIMSIFAFFWLYFILDVSSKGVVELWEAIVTLMMYPFLLLAAYLLNMEVTLKSHWHPHPRGDEGEKEIAEATFFKNGVLDKESLVQFLREVKKYPGITINEAAILAAAKLVESEPHSLLWYRMGGVRRLSSGRPLTQRLDDHLQEVSSVLMENKLARESQSQTVVRMSTPDPYATIVEFAAATVAVTETVGTFPVYLTRSGNLRTSVSVKVQSMDGMAIHNEDYVPVNEVITLEAYQVTAEVMVRILNERKYEPTEEFFLRLTPSYVDGVTSPVKIGRLSIMEVKIIHEESPGVIQFEKRGIVVDESVSVVTLFLERFNGSDGEVAVEWRTNDYTAISGIDYEGGSGVLKFQHSEVRRFLMVRIIDTMSEDKNVRFEVEILKATGGAILGDIRRVAVIITDDSNIIDFIENVMTQILLKLEQMRGGTWCKQIVEAMSVKGGEEATSSMDYLLHFLCFFWKVLFSLIPPSGLLGGWLQFFTAMAVIALMAALIGDLTSIFGCLVGIQDTVTALIFVSMGTSLPDMCACWIAMKHSKNADEAIGNINGTCSVNVFLGLGLPWTMAAIHHQIKGSTFRVPSEGFSLAVLLFSACCLISFVVLVVRRNSGMFGYAEIGGPKLGRYLTSGFLITLYVVYVVLASLNVERIIDI